MGARVNRIQIPGNPITLEQTAQLLAEAVTPGDPDAVRWLLNELLDAAQSGELRGRNPKTMKPVDVAGIPPADYAKWMMLTADDLRQLAAERHIQVEGDNVARVTATPHSAPADNVELAHAGSAKKTARTGWRQLALPYMAKVWRSGMFASMKEFFRTLEEKSGEPDSPFDKRHGELVLRGTGKPLSWKTVANCRHEIIEAASLNQMPGSP